MKKILAYFGFELTRKELLLSFLAWTVTAIVFVAYVLFIY